MKVKRFVDKNSRGAMAQARRELGPDAVILSNKQVGDRVELVAAIELDEIALAGGAVQATGSAAEPSGAAPAADRAVLSELQREMSDLRHMIQDRLSELAWQDMARQPSAKAALRARLAGLGLSRGFCALLSDKLPEQDDLEAYWQAALQLLADSLEVMQEDRLLDKGGIVALMGSTGVGKTTTIAKLAARSLLRYGSDQVAMITTDCYRIGGQEQLQTFARYLGIPMAVATDGHELQRLLGQVADKRLVLVDTAGMGQRDRRLQQQYATLQSVGYDIDAYLVLPATAALRALREVVSVFGADALAGAIITKTDEAVDLGGILDVAVESRLPLAYVSGGQKVPDDLAPARARSIVASAVELTRDDPVALSESLNNALSQHPTMVSSK